MKKSTALAVFLTLLLTTAALADGAPLSANNDNASMKEFIGPDGRIDLDAMRKSGYDGPVDIEGFNMTIDPSTGQPILQPSVAADPDDGFWDNTISFPPEGLNGDVDALIVYDGKLIAGGDFDLAGGVSVSNIASWDGINWAPLGSGTNGTVYALAISGGELIAGGSFTMAGEVPANRVAAWDGANWSVLGYGMNDQVRSLAVFDGKIVAGGYFTEAGGSGANKIALWNGSTWSPMGSGMDASVLALTVYEDQLIAAGGFTTAGGLPANKIAAWDGSNWTTLGSGFSIAGWVKALTVFDGDLIAGGAFSEAGGVAAHNIASWDGSNWSQLGTGLPDYVRALTVYDGKLTAAGGEVEQGQPFVECTYYVHSWDGSSWSVLLDYFEYERYWYLAALTVYDGELILGVGGYNILSDPSEVTNPTAWDGSKWSSLSSMMNGPVHALTVYDDKVIAGGEFTTVVGCMADYIASWDGEIWSPLGTGMNAPVYALTAYDGVLIAGGTFSEAGGVPVDLVAKWNGSNWSPLGSGITGNSVRAFTEYDSVLIVGGNYLVAGELDPEDVLAWDGFNWSSLGSLPYPYHVTVSTLTAYDGKLMAGGWGLEIPGGYYRGFIDEWDMHGWSTLALTESTASAFREVAALTVYDGELIAGGAFSEIDGVPANGIASWDGATWSPFGTGLSDYYDHVSALSLYDGQLIAGGKFSEVDGVVARNIASWDGSGWSPLGSGITGDDVSAFTVYDTMTVYDVVLIVGGDFKWAGRKEAPYLAMWTRYGSCCVLRGDINHDAQIDILDIDDFIDWLFRLGLEPPCLDEADADGDLQPDILDADYLIDYLFLYGPDPAPCPNVN